LLFRAEDGIRDYKVTGVQTCARPIFHRRRQQTEEDTAGTELSRRESVESKLQRGAVENFFVKLRLPLFSVLTGWNQRLFVHAGFVIENPKLVGFERTRFLPREKKIDPAAKQERRI